MKVFLVGDSIRLGYEPFVREGLAGRAQVFAPAENCRFAQYTLRYLHEWAKELPEAASFEVVHWNNGLWDLLRLHGDEPLTPLEMYVNMLARTHGRIRQCFPRARVIFATTTPVLEERADPSFLRRNEEIKTYNRAAVRLLHCLGAQINDLAAYARTLPAHMHSDAVHYTPEGSQLLATQVVRAVEGHGPAAAAHACAAQPLPASKADNHTPEATQRKGDEAP